MQCGSHPALFARVQPLFDNRIACHMLARPGYHHLVMDGFGGSANSFAWWAFRSVNPEPHISHHLHVPANVLRAVRYQIPTLLIIRDPESSIISLYSRGYLASLHQGLRHYCLFHRKLIPVVSHLHIATFEEVTNDMGRVIEGLNRKFSTSFAPFDHTPENAEICRQSVRKVSLPSPDRSEKKMAASRLVRQHPGIQSALKKANALYRRFQGSISAPDKAV